jgi:hypothetical protein
MPQGAYLFLQFSCVPSLRGSWPFLVARAPEAGDSDFWKKRVLHMSHGSPSLGVFFLSVDDIGGIKHRRIV